MIGYATGIEEGWQEERKPEENGGKKEFKMSAWGVVGLDAEVEVLSRATLDQGLARCHAKYERYPEEDSNPSPEQASRIYDLVSEYIVENLTPCSLNKSAYSRGHGDIFFLY